MTSWVLQIISIEILASVFKVVQRIHPVYQAIGSGHWELGMNITMYWYLLVFYSLSNKLTTAQWIVFFASQDASCTIVGVCIVYVLSSFFSAPGPLEVIGICLHTDIHSAFTFDSHSSKHLHSEFAALLGCLLILLGAVLWHLQFMASQTGMARCHILDTTRCSKFGCHCCLLFSPSS